MGGERRSLGAVRVITELTPGLESLSPWFEIAQERIDAFAAATDDWQSIHVDPELAASGPFGTTVAHGFLTLSLLVPLWSASSQIDGYRVVVNYGVNRVRFPAPVPSGSRVRAAFRIEGVEEVAGGNQATLAATVEVEGGEKPVCVAELVLRYLR
jgi:acyl dehydratase